MSEMRIQVGGEGSFDEREWLRREVLWASLMSPYAYQVDTWLNGTAVQQHNSNFSRATLFQENRLDLEAQAMSFFNQGKNLGGILSSAALFRVLRHEEPRKDGESTSPCALSVQARVVDLALGHLTAPAISIPGNDLVSYYECEKVMRVVGCQPNHSYPTRRRLFRAGKIMTALSRAETEKWRAMGSQNEENTLPVLTIPNGGHPRSAGPRVEMLQPIFQDILASDPYCALSPPHDTSVKRSGSLA